MSSCTLAATIFGKQVLNEVVGAYTAEIRHFHDLPCSQTGRGDFEQDPVL